MIDRPLCDGWRQMKVRRLRPPFWILGLIFRTSEQLINSQERNMKGELCWLYYHLAYIMYYVYFSYLLQEVGSIIGKKGEIVKRFRDEVRIELAVGNASIENWKFPSLAACSLPGWCHKLCLNLIHPLFLNFQTEWGQDQYQRRILSGAHRHCHRAHGFHLQGIQAHLQQVRRGTCYLVLMQKSHWPNIDPI